MTIIYVDGDGCAVKNEVYRVATRYSLPVRVVANHYISVPDHGDVLAIKVGNALDEADDWIAEKATQGDIVITADIPLASRCLQRGARVLGPRGREFTDDSIGNALASRELSQHLREMGIQSGGPKPMEKKDRSRFLARLDEIVNAIRRGA